MAPQSAASKTTPPADPSPLLNRELSWLEFNRRVLGEALDSRPPLFERLKFLTIFFSNLDEFFMKRVGGLRRQLKAHSLEAGFDPAATTGTLDAIRQTVAGLLAASSQFVLESLVPELKKAKVHLLSWDELTDEERAQAHAFFMGSVFPILTPLAVDPGHPFPFISNLSVSLGVQMRHPKREWEELFARVKIPDVFPLWIPTGKGEGTRLFSLYELVQRNVSVLFPGMEILGTMLFRVTRNADVELDEWEQDADDLLEMVSDGLRERRFARIVRVEYGPDAHPSILKILQEELDLGENDLYRLPLPLQYYALAPVYETGRPELMYPPWIPVVPEAFSDPEASVFDVIRHNDVLVHHPYESFSASVERFIRAAADDPKVIAIKMTLYRTGKDSPFVPLLIKAAEMGKQVACLVELQARFDEERNIYVAQTLEKAGVHVVYGVQGLKTHSKISLVVRNEKDGVRSYVHIGTGNYHARTAQLYTDLGLFTAKPAFTSDIVQLFHYLTGRAADMRFSTLLVAPVDMKESFLRLIDREIEHAKAGKGRITAQMNALEDPQLIEALYRASRAGVRIDLVVRGICCLRPGVPGLSENIRVLSVIGRFLEHSRIFYFGNGKEKPEDGVFYIGSADWMTRNLTRRVEAAAPIEDEALRRKCAEVLQVLLTDTRQGWELQADGTYRRLSPDAGTVADGSHDILMKRSSQAKGKAKRPRR